MHLGSSEARIEGRRQPMPLLVSESWHFVGPQECGQPATPLVNSKLALCWPRGVPPTPTVLVHMRRWANHNCLLGIFQEISGNISNSLEVITSIIFMRIRFFLPAVLKTMHRVKALENCLLYSITLLYWTWKQLIDIGN